MFEKVRLGSAGQLLALGYTCLLICKADGGLCRDTSWIKMGLLRFYTLYVDVGTCTQIHLLDFLSRPVGGMKRSRFSSSQPLHASISAHILMTGPWSYRRWVAF